MTPDAIAHTLVRVIALVLWLLVVLRTGGTAPDASAMQTRRWASSLLVLALMMALVFGSLVNLGLLDITISRLVYSATSAMVAIVAIAILSLHRD